MINGLTVEEYNAREKRRASIVARLHGYMNWEPGDTPERLKAAYSEITGEALPQPRGRAGCQRGGSQGRAASTD